jgi:NAD-dependent deacetylase
MRFQENRIGEAARWIKSARRSVAFTGAGISVESGIPPFRGPTGLWSKYDPSVLNIRHFLAHPLEVWSVLKAAFYESFANAQPNAAHLALAAMEARGLIHTVITQNIDNLHQAAGSQNVIEYHGNVQRLICTGCGLTTPASPSLLKTIPPRCEVCVDVLKPDCVFFGEPIPHVAHERAEAETRLADFWLVIGTTGEVMPASLLPREAKRHGATIVEINVRPSLFTDATTDLFLQGPATEVTSMLLSQVEDLPEP